MNHELVKTVCILLCMFFALPGNAQELDVPFVNPPDWTKPWCLWYWLPDERAEKFTGTADYETSFKCKSEWLKKGKRVYLDLGSVNVMAAITVNGKAMETQWMPPFRVDITDLLKKGQNSLCVRVTSTPPAPLPVCWNPSG